MRRTVFLLSLAACALAAAALVAPASPAALAAPDEPPAAPAEVKVGAPAPDFTLKDQEGKDVALSSFKGKRTIVVAFYPKAFSPGCTREMKCFASEWRKVDENGALVLAISGDPVAKQKDFATAVGVKFPLLSDESFAVAKRWGVFVPSTEGGFAARSVFIVDREGVVQWMLRDFAIPRTLDGTEFLNKLIELKPEDMDPAAVFAKLPSPEKEGKTLYVRYLQALAAENVPAIDKLLHKDFGTRPGYTPAMVKLRRDAEMDRYRRLFDGHDVKSMELSDLAVPRDSRVLAKGDDEKPAALSGFSAEAKRVAADLPEGDLLLVARTKAPKLDLQPVLPRELLLTLRKDGAEWKIIDSAGR